jgi:hypothetical protein
MSEHERYLKAFNGIWEQIDTDGDGKIDLS